MNPLKTLPDMIKNSVKNYGDRIAFKVKENGHFVPITYHDFYLKINSFATGLLHIGVNEFDHTGLVSENRLEWIISDMAIIHLRAADVPCSGNSSSGDIYFKLDHSDACAVILEGEKQFAEFHQITEPLTKIKNIILFDKIPFFSEKKSAPEWTIPLAFNENNQITKKFEKAIQGLLKNKNSLLFLSSQSKQFLLEYFKKNDKEIIKQFNADQSPSIDSILSNISKRLIVIDPQYNQDLPYQIYSFQELSRIGEELLQQGDSRLEKIVNRIQETDLATIIYTSGTTSDPKGVMLTHGNFMHNIRVTPEVQEINQNDRFLSILPSWHIFERTCEYITLATGASTAYSKPFKQILLPDLITEKPTIMVSVPRIWESVYQGVITKARKGSTIQKIIFEWAMNVGKKYKKAERTLNQTIPLFDRAEFSLEETQKAKKIFDSLGWKYHIADKLVFKKIRAITGGKLRFAISGGGALPENVDQFFDIAGIMVCEGYGLTETSPVLCARNPKHCVISTVGPTLPEVEIKIFDKDNLSNELPHGEIGIVMTKGPMVMKGYYKNEEKTAQVIRNGWFDTGDLGRKTKNGQFLQLVGRLKDTIVLRGGENIEPHPLEEKLLESDYISMAVVVGQDQPRLGALIVPNFETLKTFADREKIHMHNHADLVNNQKIMALFQNEVKRLISKENGFKPFETVIGIAICPHEFSVEDGELTETLKIKRFEIHKKYKSIIDDICG